MKRRSFLHLASLTGLVTLITPRSIVLGMSMPGAGLSAESFFNPPTSSGAYTWWHWMNGNITKSGITKDLEAMQSVGIAGFQLFEAGSGIPLGNVASLSDEWIDMITHTIKESQRLHLEFAMHNCPGWSSSGGPWITPERSMQEITFSEITAQGGHRISILLPQPPAKLNYYKDSFVVAYPKWGHDTAMLPDWKKKGNYRNQYIKDPQTKDQPDLATIPVSAVLDLTKFMNHDGLLTWDAPLGDWIILRFGHTATGQQNHSAPTLGTGLDCDKLSASALEFHFNKMFGRIMPALDAAAKTGKVGLLIDSYEMGLQNWTVKLPDEFLKRRGYPITPYLPALAGKVIGDERLTESFLWDFRRTLADLMADAYYGHFQKLCTAHNIITYTEPYEGGPFEEMQIGQKLDINMGEFWAGITNLWPNAELSRTVKLAASISRIKGQSVVGAEAFTAEPGSGKWQQYPYAMKALGDLMFTKGITRYYFHRYAHQPHPTAMPGMTMGPWGIHFERTNTWWNSSKAWLKYISRSQHVLRQGKFFADLIYFTGEEVPLKTLTPEAGAMPPPPGYDYDLINKDALVSLSIDSSQSWSLPGGSGYRILILPETKFMSISVLRVLKSLIQRGLIVVGPRPVAVPGLMDEQTKRIFQSLVDELWANLDGTTIKPKIIGKGKLYWTADLKHILAIEHLKEDLTVFSASGDAPINYIHRRVGDTDVYFLANNRRTKEHTVVSFRISGMQPEMWNPVNGSITSIYVFEVENDVTRIPLDFDESGSMFILFRKATHQKKIEVNLDGANLLPAQLPFKIANNNKSVFGNFSISGWFKPEIDIALDPDQFFGKSLTNHYAIYPASGTQLYGSGHAGMGMTAGRNGVVLFENSKQGITAVLYVKTPIAGWTHFTVLYKDNQPILYLNAEQVATGKKSDYVVHPTVGDAYQQNGASYFNGELADLTISPDRLSFEEMKSQVQRGLPKPVSALSHCPVQPYQEGLLFWKSGEYHLKGVNPKTELILVKDMDPPIQLEKKWIVSFPQNLGAPTSVELEMLQSLHKHSHDGIKHFSGTATYANTFNIPNPDLKEKRYFVDLGRVEVIAEVIVNGKTIEVNWKPPFVVDITRALIKGRNTLEVKVTNLWPNRLIGDEHLPEENEYNSSSAPGKFSVLYFGGIKKLPEWYSNGQPKPSGGRITFTTWKHYSKDSPLLESGLLGPVQISSAYFKRITPNDV